MQVFQTAPPPENSSSSGISTFSNSTAGTVEVQKLSEQEAIAQGYTVIKTAQDLDNIRNNLSGKYIFMGDIDLSAYDNWDPIGDGVDSFTGELNGNGYTIRNLKVNKGTYAGLFGYADSAIFKNIGLEKVNVIGTSQYIGGLIGRVSNGIIANCYVTGDVTGDKTGGSLGPHIDYADYVGGLIGRGEANTQISNCYSSAEVFGGTYIGGLIGSNNGNISDSYTTGKVTGYGYDAGGAGGLAGTSSGDITNCYATGEIIGYLHTGGLVGQNGGGNITNCYATGDVTSNTNTGGLVGHIFSSGGITNCYATGDVTGTTYTGGLVGYQNGTITNSFSDGDVTGNNTVGGITGCAYTGSIINNSYANGKISGTSNIGGLVGSIYRDSNISDSIWNSAKTPQGIGEDRGGTSTNNKGLTTSEMNNPDNWAGWDTNVWDLSTFPPQLKNMPVITDSGSSNEIRLQVGANSNAAANSITIDTGFDLSDLDIDFSSADNCADTLEDIDDLLAEINSKRSQFGAAMNRLESVSQANTAAIENLTASVSTIMDADMAEEAAEYTRQQILQQTTSALLTQAQNSDSSVIYALIGGI